MLPNFLFLFILTCALKWAAADPIPIALADVGIEEHLGTSVDGSISFRDETGKAVTLNDYFSKSKPILLNFAYFHCPMLCGLVQSGMVQGLKPLNWTPGKEYEILTVSIDSREGPEQAKPVKDHLLEELDKPGADSGWYVLTGDRKAIASLTSATGFKFSYMADRNEFAHGAGLIFLTPDGKVSRYLYGVAFSPHDLRLALLDASEGKSLSLGNKLLLFCYHYDSNSKGYVLFALKFMEVGGFVILGLLALFVAFIWRLEKKRKQLLSTES